MRVKQIGSNMTVVYVGGNMVLFSYETPVAAFIYGEGFYHTAQKHSRTTSKHVGSWIAGADTAPKPQEWFDSLLKVEMNQH